LILFDDAANILLQIAHNRKVGRDSFRGEPRLWWKYAHIRINSMAAHPIS
jgi:hypothetical protein